MPIDVRDHSGEFPQKQQLAAPEGAPNVLVVLIDDMGFGASSAFGGPCAMPTAERLAGDGLRYSRFHTTAVCSPTRAALMTGRNHHSVGMGSLPELASAAPSYDAIRPLSAGTLAQTLNYNGYATGAFGKWHQTPAWEWGPTGPFDRWPTNEGFEKFYGFMGGAANQYSPSLLDGHRFIDPPAGEDEGYHLSEDLVDQTKDWIRRVRTFDTRPWFAYLSFGATHSPFHVPESWRDRRRGDFDGGWDVLREQTLQRQKALGVVPEETELAPWPADVPHWDDLDDTQRAVGARMMEIYAAFAEHTDAQVGRLVDHLEQLGELDNTLVLYVLGDNGASPEGGFEGAINESRRYNGIVQTSEEMLSELDGIGGPKTFPHYPTGWALSLNTPYQWAKLVASHYGGTRNGLIAHWPERIADSGGIRNQWHHVIDVVPTVLEAVGIPAPETIEGIEQDPIQGTSFQYTFDDADAKGRHLTQYFEVFGNRGIYHHGWTAVTKHLTPWEFFNLPERIAFDDDRWELYDTDSDWSQARDLSAEHPEKLAELQKLFLEEARKNEVLPLDDRDVAERIDAKSAGRRLPAAARSVVLTHDDGHLRSAIVPNMKNTSFQVFVDLEADEGSDGVLVAYGGWQAGWSLYVSAGRLTYVYNFLGLEWTYIEAEVELAPGRHLVEFRYEYDGGGPGRGGNGRFFIDGEDAGGGRLERTVPVGAGSSDAVNVGIDRGSPVTDRYSRGDGNRYRGQIESVTIRVGDDLVEPSGEQIVKSAMATQ
jgi:arylsulfatase